MKNLDFCRLSRLGRPYKGKLLLLLCCCIAGFTGLRPANALTAYLLDGNSQLVTFDTNNPAATKTAVIEGLSTPYSVVGIAIRTTTRRNFSHAGVGSLWGIAYNSFAPPGKEFFLCTINPATAFATQVSAFLDLDASGGADAMNFGFDPASDSFRFTSVQYNYSINANNFAVTRQANFPGFPAQSGAAFAPSPYTGGTSRFYNVSRQSSPRLLQTSTDISSGRLTRVGTGNLGDVNAPLALAFGNRTLYMASERLYAVDVETGKATDLGGINGSPGARGLTIVPKNFPPKASIAVRINGSKSIFTAASSRSIKGTATTNAGVDSVEYRVGTKGKYKKVKGRLTKWKFTAKLKPGKNVISVRASVGSITSKVAKITVTRQ